MLEKIECPTSNAGRNIRIPDIYKPHAGEREIFESVPFILCRYTVSATIRNQIDFSLIVYSILRICKVIYFKKLEKREGDSVFVTKKGIRLDSFLFSSERGIRTLDTTGMNRML